MIKIKVNKNDNIYLIEILIYIVYKYTTFDFNLTLVTMYEKLK